MSKPTDAMRRIRENSKPEWASYKVGMTQVMRCDGCGNEVEWPHSLYRYGIKSLRRVCENCKLLQERSAK